MARKIENTLYVTKNEAYVKKKQDIIIVEIKQEEALRIPGHHLGNILLFERAGISHQALKWCANNEVSVARIDRNGKFIGRWVGPVSGNVMLRLDQFKIYDNKNKKFRAKIARNFVKGKLYNSRSMLQRSARDIENKDSEENLRKAAEDIKKLITKLDDTCVLEEIRGFEGRAANIYFSCVNDMILKNSNKFNFTGRSKRPPKDKVNAMFSYLYVILLNDCCSALESIGLDPQIGYLHDVRPGKPSLALDLMEELRPVMAERVVLTLINREQVKASDFEEKTGGAVLMTEECRKLLIKMYQEKKQEEITHTFHERKVPYGLIPYLQARLLARSIRGETEEYYPFLYE